MNSYQLMIDIWEGNPVASLDAEVLKEAGVVGAFVRLNDMGGGHHMDEQFITLWDWVNTHFECNGIYFVYNPWPTGKQNYAWLKANLPADYHRRVANDVEVAKAGYSPEVYADELGKFVAIELGEGHAVADYSGGWFTTLLSHWPVVDSWWAAYPDILTNSKSWTEYKANLLKLDFATWTRSAPHPAKLWQCTGDHCILPGMGGHAVDINAYPGSLEDLRTWLGYAGTEPGTGLEPAPTGTGMHYEVLTPTLNIRRGPGLGYPIMGRLTAGAVVQAQDAGGSDVWIQIGDGQWVALETLGKRYLGR